MKKLVVILSIFLLASCVSAPWIKGGGSYRSDKLGYTAELPQGWMKFKVDDYLLATRDGVLLQMVYIQRFSVTVAPAHTKKRFRPHMTPGEISEVIVDDLGLDPMHIDFSLEENKPVMIDGLSGFRISCSFKSPLQRLTYRSAIHGFMTGEWIYVITYTAPKRYYFDRDLSAFEKVVSSFRLFGR
jgi:hypothetical protein